MPVDVAERVPEIAKRLGAGVQIGKGGLIADTQPAVEDGVRGPSEARSLEKAYSQAPSKEPRRGESCDLRCTFADQSRLRHKRTRRLRPLVPPTLFVAPDS